MLLLSPPLQAPLLLDNQESLLLQLLLRQVFLDLGELPQHLFLLLLVLHSPEIPELLLRQRRQRLMHLEPQNLE